MKPNQRKLRVAVEELAARYRKKLEAAEAGRKSPVTIPLETAFTLLKHFRKHL